MLDPKRHYAAAALTGLLANANMDGKEDTESYEYYVQWAWDIAEAMEREEQRRASPEYAEKFMSRREELDDLYRRTEEG
jgi:hypothetical protein